MTLEKHLQKQTPVDSASNVCLYSSSSIPFLGSELPLQALPTDSQQELEAE